MSVRYIYQTHFGMSDPPCKSVLIDGITVYDGLEESLFTDITVPNCRPNWEKFTVTIKCVVFVLKWVEYHIEHDYRPR